MSFEKKKKNPTERHWKIQSIYKKLSIEKTNHSNVRLFI